MKIYAVYFYWYNWDGLLEPTLDAVYSTEKLARKACELLKEDNDEDGLYEPFYEEMEVKDKLE